MTRDRGGEKRPGRDGKNAVIVIRMGIVFVGGFGKEKAVLVCVIRVRKGPGRGRVDPVASLQDSDARLICRRLILLQTVAPCENG